jgi:hypothetical protein
MTIVAERELIFFGANGPTAGFIRFEEPKPDQNDWRCDYSLEWDGLNKRHYTMGVDSYQALLLALQTAPTMIESTVDFRAGRIGALGQRITTHQELREIFGVTRLVGIDP